MVEPVPVVGTGFLWDRTFWSRSLKRRAIDEKNVKATVIVVIKEGDTRTHGFRQIVLGRVGREVIEVDSRCRGDVHKFTGKRLLRIGRGTQLLSSNHPH